MKKVLLLLWLIPTPLQAQTTGFSGYDLNFTRPPRDGSGLVFSPGSGRLRSAELLLGSVFHWREGLLAVRDVATDQTVRVVDRLFVTDLFLSYGFADWVSLGFGIPLIVNGRETNLPAPSPYAFFDVGDADLELKWNLVRGSPVGLSFLTMVTLPTGNPGRFTGFDDPTYGGQLVIDKRFNRLYLDLNAGYRLVPKKSVLSIPVDDHLSFGGGVGIDLGQSWELFGEVTGFTVPSNPQGSNSPVLVLGGIRRNFGRGAGRVLLAGGRGMTDGAGASEWTAAGGVQYKFKRQRKPIDTERIYFAFDKAEFLSKWQPVLNRVADRFFKNRRSTLVISVGYADSEGEESYNNLLSLERARNVARALIEKGIPIEQIQFEGRGELDPVSDNRTREGKAKNRRVEIRVFSCSLFCPGV